MTDGEVEVDLIEAEEGRWWWRTIDQCGGPFCSEADAMKHCEENFDPYFATKDPRKMTVEELEVELPKLKASAKAFTNLVAVQEELLRRRRLS
jgi:hypothetical protein